MIYEERPEETWAEAMRMNGERVSQGDGMTNAKVFKQRYAT